MIIHHDFRPVVRSKLDLGEPLRRSNPDHLFVGFGFQVTLSPLVLRQNESRHIAMSHFLDMEIGDFQRLLPKQIFTPLISGQFDVFEVASKLDQMGFQGALRAVGSAVPDPQIVCREIGLAFPAIDFDVLEVGELVTSDEILKIASS